eukprot:scaffold276_cov548-Prasinococcus_capsulatus_cf.AAC.9
MSSPACTVQMTVKLWCIDAICGCISPDQALLSDADHLHIPLDVRLQEADSSLGSRVEIFRRELTGDIRAPADGGDGYPNLDVLVLHQQRMPDSNSRIKLCEDLKGA